MGNGSRVLRDETEPQDEGLIEGDYGAEPNASFRALNALEGSARLDRIEHALDSLHRTVNLCWYALVVVLALLAYMVSSS